MDTDLSSAGKRVILNSVVCEVHLWLLPLITEMFLDTFLFNFTGACPDIYFP